MRAVGVGVGVTFLGAVVSGGWRSRLHRDPDQAAGDTLSFGGFENPQPVGAVGGFERRRGEKER